MSLFLCFNSEVYSQYNDSLLGVYYLYRDFSGKRSHLDQTHSITLLTENRFLFNMYLLSSEIVSEGNWTYNKKTKEIIFCSDYLTDSLELLPISKNENLDTSTITMQFYGCSEFGAPYLTFIYNDCLKNKKVFLDKDFSVKMSYDDLDSINYIDVYLYGTYVMKQDYAKNLKKGYDYVITFIPRGRYYFMNSVKMIFKDNRLIETLKFEPNKTINRMFIAPTEFIK